MEPNAGGAGATIEGERHGTRAVPVGSATYDTRNTAALGLKPRNTPSSWTSSCSTARAGRR